MMREIENDPFHTAIHEASPAVIRSGADARLQRSNHRTGYEAGRAGYSITEDPYICGSEWPKRGKVRDPAAVWCSDHVLHGRCRGRGRAARVYTRRRRRRQISN